MNVRYRVELDEPERQQLQALVAGGTRAVRKVKRAQILLAADAGSTDEQIMSNVHVSTATVYRTKRRFVEEGLERALEENSRPGAKRKLSTNDVKITIFDEVLGSPR